MAIIKAGRFLLKEAEHQHSESTQAEGAHTEGAAIFSPVTTVCPFCCFSHLINVTSTSFKETYQIQRYEINHS